MTPLVRPWCSLLLAAVFAAAEGCAQLDLKKPLDWPSGADEKPGVPEKVVAIWSDTVLHQPERTPTRGFGGRLMFYGKDDRPVKVNGTLVVYAFDENGRDPTDHRPDRKYVFPPEQLDKHYSKSDLGHSYSVWVPCGKVGGPQQEVSLIVRFIPSGGGPVVVGNQSRQLLPGADSAVAQQTAPGGAAPRVHAAAAPPAQAPATTPGVQLTSHEVRAPGGEAESGPPRRTEMGTTTINVPPRFGRFPTAATCAPVNSPAQGAPAPQVPATGPIPATQAALPPGQPAPATRQGPGRPSVGYPPSRPQPQGGPFVPPTRDRVRMQPSPVTSPYRQRPAPQPANEYGSAGYLPAAGPVAN